MITKVLVREVLDARKAILSEMYGAGVNKQDVSPKQFTDAVMQYINGEFDVKRFLTMLNK